MTVLHVINDERSSKHVLFVSVENCCELAHTYPTISQLVNNTIISGPSSGIPFRPL